MKNNLRNNRVLKLHLPRAPGTGKQTILTQNMHMEWKIVTENLQVTRKLTEFAKMCCACNTSPKLALRTSVTAVTFLVFFVTTIPWDYRTRV